MEHPILCQIPLDTHLKLRSRRSYQLDYWVLLYCIELVVLDFDVH